MGRQGLPRTMQVYELQAYDHAGHQQRVLVEIREDAEMGRPRLAWDDTRAAAWHGEFGWVTVLPGELPDIPRSMLSHATRRSDLEPDVMKALDHPQDPQRSAAGLLGIGAVLASPEAGELYERQQRALAAAANALVPAFPRNEQYARNWAEIAVQAYLLEMRD